MTTLTERKTNSMELRCPRCVIERGNGYSYNEDTHTGACVYCQREFILPTTLRESRAKKPTRAAHR